MSADISEPATVKGEKETWALKGQRQREQGRRPAAFLNARRCCRYGTGPFDKGSLNTLPRQRHRPWGLLVLQSPGPKFASSVPHGERGPAVCPLSVLLRASPLCVRLELGHSLLCSVAERGSCSLESLHRRLWAERRQPQPRSLLNSVSCESSLSIAPGRQHESAGVPHPSSRSAHRHWLL